MRISKGFTPKMTPCPELFLSLASNSIKSVGSGGLFLSYSSHSGLPDMAYSAVSYVSYRGSSSSSVLYATSPDPPTIAMSCLEKNLCCEAKP